MCQDFTHRFGIGVFGLRVDKALLVRRGPHTSAGRASGDGHRINTRTTQATGQIGVKKHVAHFLVMTGWSSRRPSRGTIAGDIRAQGAKPDR